MRTNLLSTRTVGVAALGAVAIALALCAPVAAQAPMGDMDQGRGGDARDAWPGGAHRGAGEPWGHGMMHAQKLSLSPEKAGEAYVKFLAQHEQTAIEMADLVAERTAHPELADFAANVSAERQQDLDRLATLMGVSPAGPMDATTNATMDVGPNATAARTMGGAAGAAMPTEERLSAAKARGMDAGGMRPDWHVSALTTLENESFDRAYLDLMILHDHMASHASQYAQELAGPAELRAFASETAQDRAAEVETLQAWRAAWFGANTTAFATGEGYGPGVGAGNATNDTAAAGTGAAEGANATASAAAGGGGDAAAGGTDAYVVVVGSVAAAGGTFLASRTRTRGA